MARDVIERIDKSDEFERQKEVREPTVTNDTVFVLTKEDVVECAREMGIPAPTVDSILSLRRQSVNFNGKGEISMIKLNILGQKISLSNSSLYHLKELRQELKKAGGPELLSDIKWSNRRSSIPPRTMRDLSNIPHTAGFVRGTRNARQTYIGRRLPSTVSSSKFDVEEDTLIDEEFQRIPELTEIFMDCLTNFPELTGKEIECRATYSNELSAAKGTLKQKPVVILFVPNQAWGQWAAFRPLILHELCHFIDNENPDKVFEERADKKSKVLWRKLRDLGQLRCSSDEDKTKKGKTGII